MRVLSIASILFLALASCVSAGVLNNQDLLNADVPTAIPYPGLDFRAVVLETDFADYAVDRDYNTFTGDDTDVGQLFDTLGATYDNCYLSSACSTADAIRKVEYQFNFATLQPITISWFRVQQTFDPSSGAQTPPLPILNNVNIASTNGDQYPAGELRFLHRASGAQDEAGVFEEMTGVTLGGVPQTTGYGFTGWDVPGSVPVWSEFLKFEFDEALCWDYMIEMKQHPWTIQNVADIKFISLCEWELGHDVGTFDDPIVKGFNGQSFYFMGSVNDVYNLISSEHFQLNTRIISHPGMFKLNSWMGEIGIKAYGHTVSFTNNSVALCDDKPCVDGKYQSLSDLFEVKFSSKDGSLDITLDQNIKIALRVDGGAWTGNNTHLDFSFTGDASPLGTMHGILGQTAYKARNQSVLAGSTQGEGVIDGTYLDYLVSDGLFGEKFTFNKYSFDGEDVPDFIGGASRRLLSIETLHGSVGTTA